MAARTWFTKQNTADLDPADLQVLNRALRYIVDGQGVPATRQLLMRIRMSYKRGMSAIDIIDAIEPGTGET